MKIQLKNGKAVTEETIRDLQAALGFQISDSFTRFLRSNDGAEPQANMFKVASNNDSGVNKFIDASEITKERSRIENIPAKGYPVAWAEGGNYVIVDEGKNGAVFFWDHEIPNDIVEVAPDFDAFLESLEPFDIKKVELKPGQVKKAWVDPEFLKRLKR